MALELAAISLGLSTFADRLAGRQVVAFSDNVGAECALRSANAHSFDHARIVRTIWLQLAEAEAQGLAGAGTLKAVAWKHPTKPCPPTQLSKILHGEAMFRLSAAQPQYPRAGGAGWGKPGAGSCSWQQGGG